MRHRPPTLVAPAARSRLGAGTLAAAAAVGLLTWLAPTAASATDTTNAAPAACATGDGPALVVQVSGRLDPVMVDYIDDQVGQAEQACAVAVVLQLNSGGAVGNEDGAADLTDTLAAATVPIAIWVGPSGSKATGAAADLLAVADQTALAAERSSVEVTRSLLAARDVAPSDLGDVDVGDRVSAKRAVELGLVDSDTASIGDFLLGLPGFESKSVGDGQREPVTQVAFTKLPILGQLMHTVASPAVAYLLFVIGLALLLFELFTAGVGVAGVVGAGTLILGSYGLASLPTRPVGVALLLLAMFGYAVDVQTGVPRVWSGIATVAFVLGSITLFDGASVSWITLLVAITGMTLGMLAGMPTMVRSRFATPTIGRDWMVGELGQARTAISPDGVVMVRDAPWRARTNRATPIEKDESVRVVAIEGLVLEVEPESGGAQDYRERAKQRG